MAKVPRAPDLERLRTLEPALKRLPAGTRLWRLYLRAGRHPTAWNEFRHVGPVETARFDHHLPDPHGNPTVQERSILYAAYHPYTCLAEVYQNRRTIHRCYHQPWLVAFETTCGLDLLDLTGPFSTQSGASMGLMSCARSVARRWAQGYYEAYPQVHGLCYPSSMYANAMAVALTDRSEASGVLPGVPIFHRALADPAMLSIIRNAARVLGYALR
jgi:hypothetical protein